jgi:hypothetical protein
VDRRAAPGQSPGRCTKLIDEAGRRFDLTPLDSEFLLRHLSERKSS